MQVALFDICVQFPFGYVNVTNMADSAGICDYTMRKMRNVFVLYVGNKFRAEVSFLFLIWTVATNFDLKSYGCELFWQVMKLKGDILILIRVQDFVWRFINIIKEWFFGKGSWKNIIKIRLLSHISCIVIALSRCEYLPAAFLSIFEFQLKQPL